MTSESIDGFGRRCPACSYLRGWGDAGKPADECPACGRPYPRRLFAAAESAAPRLASLLKRPAGGWGTVALGFAIWWFIKFGFVGSEQAASKMSSPPTLTEKVYNSPYDGSVRQVERHLKSTLRDPDSFQAIEWTPVIKHPNGSFSVSVTFRAKNGFGGYNVERRTYTLDAEGLPITMGAF